ncbi:hypothetical protein ATANTOWER_004208, partial [Ataeniobius toweri]|nr:hypothetical protein [Ataeniobius toweri]
RETDRERQRERERDRQRQREKQRERESSTSVIFWAIKNHRMNPRATCKPVNWQHMNKEGDTSKGAGAPFFQNQSSAVPGNVQPLNFLTESHVQRPSTCAHAKRAGRPINLFQTAEMISNKQTLASSFTRSHSIQKHASPNDLQQREDKQNHLKSAAGPVRAPLDASHGKGQRKHILDSKTEDEVNYCLLGFFLQKQTVRMKLSLTQAC